ncbi:unnamed protein product [Arctia plantaginis]|uniref:Uncharacterized protein n=1 Tax=Arctia plantaginis TaxID=874455 RepID=A0A8S1AZ91_ARCPL|nr:unnamed protein product [Arctia plantaginis]
MSNKLSNRWNFNFQGWGRHRTGRNREALIIKPRDWGCDLFIFKTFCVNKLGIISNLTVSERWPRRVKRGRVRQRRVVTLAVKKTNTMNVCWSATSALTRLATPSSACVDTYSGMAPQ